MDESQMLFPFCGIISGNYDFYFSGFQRIINVSYFSHILREAQSN